jgi:parallel beta-helix repeat protein
MVGNDAANTLMASPGEINVNGGNFSYNVLDNNGFGIYVYRSKRIVISHNEVKNSSTSGPGSPGNGIHLSKSPPATYVMTGNTIEYNSVHDNGRHGIYLAGVSGTKIYGNSVNSNNDYNVYIDSYVYGILFAGNTIGASTSTYGLIIEDGLGGGTGAYPKNMVVNYNSFANSNGAVGVKHYYGTLNIKYNWWGDSAGPNVRTNGTWDGPGSSGRLHIWPGMSANYTSWLTSFSPDLVISKIYAPSRTSAGATISVKDITWNKGADNTSTFKTKFYLSEDTTLDGGDVSLGERSISELAGGTKSTGTTFVNIPSGTTPGMYFIIGKADADNVITESNEDNNTKYRMITIGPDLQVSSLIAPASASKGATINITDTTRNNGAAEAISSTTKFYLSTNRVLDLNDTSLGSRSIPILAAHGSSTGDTSVTIPLDTSPNMWYYIIGKADADSNITEYNENNNVRIKAIWITP